MLKLFFFPLKYQIILFSEEESGDFEKNTLTRRSYKSATRKSQITKSTTEAISKSDPEISKQDPKPNPDGHQNNNKSEKLPKRKESLLRKILPSFKPKSKKNKNDKNPEFHALETPQKSSKKSSNENSSPSKNSSSPKKTKEESKWNKVKDIDEKKLQKICSKSISRHLSMHNTRNNTKNNSKIGTGPSSKHITRNSSKIDDQKRRKVKRKKDGSKSDDLKKVSQLLNQELKMELGRQPSNNPNSVYELKPTVCQSQNRTADVVFHVQTDGPSDETSKSSSLRSTLPDPVDFQGLTVNGPDAQRNRFNFDLPAPPPPGGHFDQTDSTSEFIEEVPPTPATQTNTRPTSGLYNLPSSVAHDGLPNTTDDLEDKFVDEYDLEDTVDYITKTMEDITASNPEFRNQTDGLNALFRDYAKSIIRGASYNAFQEMMRPFLKFRGTDVEVEGLLLSATVSTITGNETGC